MVTFIETVMTNFNVTRAHLKNAVEQRQWDLLDKLLEISTKHIDDNAYFTDTWGEWWGLLLECVLTNQEQGVRILLKHGANRKIGNWGDCIPMTPIEAAAGKPQILALLAGRDRPNYTRKTDPALPISETNTDRAVNQQGHVRDQTGMVFQVDAIKR